MRAVELFRQREGFSKSEMDTIQETYTIFDRDLSGSLSLDEFTSALAWLGLPLRREKIEPLFKQETRQSRQDGLSKREFLRLLRCAHEREMDSVERIMAEWDSDSEYVHGWDLQALLQTLGYNVPASAVFEAIQDVCPQSAEQHGDVELLEGLSSLSGLRFKLGSADMCDVLTALRLREGFSRDEWQGLRRVFDRFSEAVGELSVQGLGRALRWVGHPCSLNRVRDLMADLDLAGGGASEKFDFKAFVKIVRKCRDAERARAVEAFRLFDVNKLGALSHDQKEQALLSLGCVDGSGGLPAWIFNEPCFSQEQAFVQIVQRFRLQSLEHTRENAGYTYSEVREFVRLFEEFDADGSGDIGRKELCHLIEYFFPAYANSPHWRPQLVALLDEVDSDHSGTLDFLEFLHLMRRIREEEDKDRLKLEMKTIEQSGFSMQEVQDLRKLFLGAAGEGGDVLNAEEILGTEQVCVMVTSCCALGDRASQLMDSLMAKAIQDADSQGTMVCPHLRSARRGEDKVNFPVFLCIMKRVADSALVEPSKHKSRHL